MKPSKNHLMFRSFRSKPANLLATAFIFVCGVAAARAATLWWDGASTTANGASDNTTTTGQNWLSGGNWDNGATSAAVSSWTAGDSAIFGGSAASQTITAGTITVGNLTFGLGGQGATTGSAPAYTISGGTLSLSNSIITANTPAVINSGLAGSTGLVAAGASTLTLGGNNTYTGATVVNSGTLKVTPSAYAPYRYYKFTVSANYGNDGYNQVGELHYYYNGVWTAATAGFNTGSGSGEQYWGNANDNKGTSGSFSKYGVGGVPYYVTYDFGSPTVFNSYNWSTGNDSTPSRNPKRWIVAGSNDNSTWITLDDRSGSDQAGPTSTYTWSGTTGSYAAVTNGANDGATNAYPISGTGNIPQSSAVQIASGATLDLNGCNQVIASLADSGAGGGYVSNSVTNKSVGLILGGASGTTTFSGQISDSGSSGAISLTKQGAYTQVLAGTNTYSGSTTVNAGTLQLAAGGQISTTGTLSISAGTFDLNGRNQTVAKLTGAGGAVTNSASANSDLTISLAAGVGSNYAGTLTTPGSGNLNVIVNSTAGGGASSLALSNTSNTFKGTITVNGTGYLDGADGHGMLGINTEGALGDTTNPIILNNGGTLCNMYNPGSGGGWPSHAAYTLGAGRTITLSGLGGVIRIGYGDTCTINSQITGSGGLSRTDGGTLILGGSISNTYTGDTNLGGNGRILLAKTGGAIGIAGNINICSASWNGNGMGIVLAGDEQIADTSVVTWTSGGYGGTLRLNGHTETVGGLVCTSSGLDPVVENRGNGDGTSYGTGTLIINTAGSSNYTFSGNIRNMDGGSGGGTVAITKTGTGTQVLTGTLIDHSGPTTVNGGTLKLQDLDDMWTSALTVSSGAVLEFATTVRDFNMQSTPRSITGGGTLLKSGSYNWYTWSGGVTFAMDSGALVDVQGGQMQLRYGGSQNFTNNKADLNVNSGAAFDLWDNTTSVIFDALTGAGTLDRTQTSTGTLVLGADDGSGTFSGAINNTAGTTNLVKTGTGTQALSGANTYGGTTTVNGGTLEINGSTAGGAVTVASGATLAGTGIIGGAVSVQSGGTLAPGSGGIGTLTTSNALTLGGDATFEFNKSGTTCTCDAVTGFSSVTYGGTLTITLTGDAPALGDSYELFTPASGGTYAGAFTSIVGLPTLSAGLQWETTSLLSTGRISVVNYVSTPGFSPAGGGYTGAQSVTITSDSGATIYYTMDGSTPTTSSAHGASPLAGITIPDNSNVTLKAFAKKAGQADSPLAEATYHTVTVATWNVDADGMWSDPANWLNTVVPNGSGVPVDFSVLPQSGNATVTLDIGRTVGSLKFGNTEGFTWALAPASNSILTLATPSGTPTIHTPDVDTTISAALAGTQGLAKTGAGTLVLTGPNSYVGGTSVNAGTLQIGNGSANGTFGGSTYSIASDARLYLNYGSVSPATWANIIGSGTLELKSASGGDWAGGPGQNYIALPGGFTGTLVVDSGRVPVNTQTSLGGATAVVIKNGAQLGDWLGGTFAQDFTLAGNGWGEGNYEVAIRGGSTILNGSVTLSGDTALGGVQLNGTLHGAGHALTVGSSSSRDVTLNSSTGAGSDLGGIALNYGLLTIGGSGNVVVNGGISGPGGSGRAGLSVASGGVLTATSFGTAYNVSQFQINGTASLGAVSFSVAANPVMTGSGTLTVSSLTIANWTGLTDNMTGGTMNVGTGGIVNGGTGSNTFAIGATTIGATDAWSSSMAMTLNDATTGATFDTTGGNITLTGALGGGRLNKSGAGTLLLGGANTYTGTTAVNNGTLLVDGSLSASSTAIVAPAATLGGIGSMPGTVAVAGTVAPGSNGIGTLTTGNTTLTGTYACEVIAADADKLAVTGNLDITGGTLAITAAAPTASSYVIASYTGSLTGTFASVTGLPSGYALVHDSGAKQLQLVKAGYMSWIATFGLSGADALPAADPDHDGIANLAEYVLNGNPNQSSQAILPTCIADADNCVFTFIRSVGSATDTTQVFEYGTNLATDWQGIGILTPSTDPRVVLGPESGGVQSVTVTIPKDGKTSIFGRLKVTQP